MVKEFQYTNPHSWLLVDVTDKNGKVTTWGFEAEGPEHTAARRHPSERVSGRHQGDDDRQADEGRTPAAIWVLAVRGDGKKYDPRAGFQVK